MSISTGNGRYINLPLSSCLLLGQPTNLTIMFFFRLDFLKMQLSEGHQPFFMFQDSVSCIIDEIFDKSGFSQTAITCQNQDRNQITVSTSQQSDYISWDGKWLHFAMGIQQNGNAYIQIRDGLNLVAETYSKSFSFEQSSQDNNQICFGLCDFNFNTIPSSDESLIFGFPFSLREAYIRNTFIDSSRLNDPDYIHRIQLFKSDVLGYYRFRDQFEQFSLNTMSFGIYNSSSQQWQTDSTLNEQFIENNYVSVDVCPYTYRMKNLPIFSKNTNSTISFSFNKKLLQKNYTYQMSLTLHAGRKSCWSNNIKNAQSGCNIFLLEGVFMLYLSGPNQARFHFFAQKDYYQTQTSAFYLPYNQWITIQTLVGDSFGYQVIILNREGKILSQISGKNKMNDQIPVSNIQFGSGLDGYISRFIMTEKFDSIPKANYQFNNPLFNIDFSNITTVRKQTILQNLGSVGNLNLSYQVNMQQIPYKLFEYGQPIPIKTTQNFDGVACNDQHMTLRLDYGTTLNYTLISGNSSSNDFSIQFWFKFDTYDVFNSTSPTKIFQLLTKSEKNKILEVSVQNQQLQVSLFQGQYNITFQNFSLDSLDFWGWWHLTCSHSDQEFLNCTLINTQLIESQSIQTFNRSFLYNMSNTKAVFGLSTYSLFLKEFRFWNRTLYDIDEIQSTMYQQIYLEWMDQLNSDQPWYPSGLIFYDPMTLNSLKNLQQDYYTQQNVVYQQNTQQIIFSSQQQNHIICPSLTYRKDGQFPQCYKNPINKIMFAIFPQFDKTINDVVWTFTVEKTSLISALSWENLVIEWQQLKNEDPVLQSQLKSSIIYNYPDQWNWQPLLSYDTVQKIPSKYLRHEDSYYLGASISNIKQTFKEEYQLIFIPSKCKWFETDGVDSFSARQVINDFPGKQDISFSLRLVKNQGLDCSNFNFYDVLGAISYEIILDNNDQYFIPWTTDQDGNFLTFNITWEQTNDPSNGDMMVVIVLGSNTQYMLPLWTDIQIFMKITWQSSLLNSSSTNQSINSGMIGDMRLPVFQNLLYTLQIAPSGLQLVSSIIQNAQYVVPGQSLILQIVNTKLGDLDPQSIQSNLIYDWTCPTGLESLCIGQQSQNAIYIPSNLLQNVGNTIVFGSFYTFYCNVSLSKLNQTITLSTKVMWFNSMPNFEILCTSDFSSSTNQNTICEIVGLNFQADNELLSQFNYKWQINPTVTEIQYTNQQLILPNSKLSPNQLYNISVMLILNNNPSVNSTKAQYFYTPSFSQRIENGSQQNEKINQSQSQNQNQTQNQSQNSSASDFSSNQTENSNTTDQNQTQDNTGSQSQENSTNQSDANINNTLNLLMKHHRTLQNEIDNRISNNFSQEFFVSILQNIQTLEEQSISINAIINQTQSLMQNFKNDPTQVRNLLLGYDMLLDICSDQSISPVYVLPLLSSLSQISKYNDPTITDQILIRLQDLPAEFEYVCDQFQITSKIFNYKTAQMQALETIKALDSIYILDSNDIYQQFPTQPRQDFYIQSIAIMTVNNTNQVLLRIIDSISYKSYLLGELNGLVKLSFQITESSQYRPNQTLCFAKKIEGWSSDICLTQLDINTKTVNCTCSMIEGTLISLMNDFSQTIGEPIQFNNELDFVDIFGKSYLFVGIMFVISFYGFICSLYAWKLDRADWYQIKNSPKTALEQELVLNVSLKLIQPIDQVKLRARDLIMFKFNPQNAFFYFILGTHPLLSPIFSFNSVQPRLTRFLAYLLQINIIVLASMVYFSAQFYRQDSILKSSFVIDAVDVNSLTYVATVIGFLLLPIISEPISYLLQNKILIVKSNVQIIEEKVILRMFLQCTSLILNINTVIGAVIFCQSSPVRNQYLMASSLLCGFLFGTFITNLVRILVNFNTNEKWFCLKQNRAYEMLRDLKCVRDLSQTDNQQADNVELQINYQLNGNRVITEEPLQIENTEQCQHQNIDQRIDKERVSIVKKYENLSKITPESARDDS